MRKLKDGRVRVTRNQWNRQPMSLPDCRFLFADEQYLYFEVV